MDLVHWKVMFPTTPGPVTFPLDPTGTPTCATVGGCAPDENSFLYVGPSHTGQMGLVFGAPYVPAFLNWEEKPDLAPRGAGKHFREVGVCQRAQL